MLAQERGDRRGLYQSRSRGCPPAIGECCCEPMRRRQRGLLSCLLLGTAVCCSAWRITPLHRTTPKGSPIRPLWSTQESATEVEEEKVAPPPLPPPRPLADASLSILQALRQKIGLLPLDGLSSPALLEETAQYVNNRTDSDAKRYEQVLASLQALKAEQASFMAEREKEIEEIEAQSAGLKTLKAKVKLLEKDLERTRKDLKAAQNQKREIEYRLAGARTELSEEKKTNAVLVNDLKRRLVEEERRASDLEEREAALAAEKAEAQGRMDEAMGKMTALFEQERAEMGARLSSLTEALGLQTKAAETAKRAVERVKSSYERDNGGLQALLEKQRRRYATTFMEMDVRIKSLEDDLADYEALRGREKEREARLMYLETEVEETKAALGRATVEGQEARKKLAVEVEGRAVAEAQVDTLQSLYDEETKRLELSLNKVMARLDVSEGERKKAEDEVAQLRAKREEDRERLELLVGQYEKTVSDQAGAVEALQADLRRVSEELSDSQARRRQAEEMVVELERKREEDRQYLAELTSRYEAEIRRKADTIGSLEQRASTDEARIASLTNSLASVEGKLAVQADEYAKALEQNRRLYEREIEVYKAQARGYEMRANAEADNAKRERERLRRSVRVFTGELSRLHAERQSVRSLLAQLLGTCLRKLTGREDRQSQAILERAKSVSRDAAISAGTGHSQP